MNVPPITDLVRISRKQYASLTETTRSCRTQNSFWLLSFAETEVYDLLVY